MNTTIILWGICGLVSYLVGAIPTGYLIARARGVDIRSVGSGNIGATNVFRAVGKVFGVLTLAADIVKGFVPVFLLPRLASLVIAPDTGEPVNLTLLCAALAIAGHNWPIYLRFKGGKGVATSMGALIAIAPFAALSGFIVWLAIFLMTRYVSLSSMVASVVVCAVSWTRYTEKGIQVPLAFTVLAILLVLRHKSNIKRLINGNENRIGGGGPRTTVNGPRTTGEGEEHPISNTAKPGQEAVAMAATPDTRHSTPATEKPDGE